MADLTARRAQFEFERSLRGRILDSPPEQRAAAIASAYGELFQTFPDHSVFQTTAEERRRQGRRGAAMVGPLTRAGERVLEVGCGRGDVLTELAERGRVCVGIEPSEKMIDMCPPHPRVSLHVGTAERLEFPDEFFHAVFSQQVLEHLHPDDVPQHLMDAFRVLRPGGFIAIETPNRRTGPQDISRGFTREPQGLHLKEWTYAELAGEMRRAGFVHVRGLLAPPYIVRRLPLLHRCTRVPAWMRAAEDVLLAITPGRELRRLVARGIGSDDVFLFARKPAARRGGQR
jgi:SAM-dependent methyltransferase